MCFIISTKYLLSGAGRGIICAMKLESVGILIGMRPMGERDSVARIFTRDFGIMCGVLRGAQVARTNRPLVGQIGAVAWNARLESQLGTFHWESARNLAAPIMMSGEKLSCMNCAFDLIQTLLPEREAYSRLYDETLEMLVQMAVGDSVDTYLNWEIALLRELGYALDLSHCSGCGARENLNWLSPRTGRAVCDNCAAPYIGRLYKLPLTLDTTLRFVENICTSLGATVPSSRMRIMAAAAHKKI